MSGHFELVAKVFRKSKLTPIALFYPGRDPDYAANLQNSKFALCPSGNVIDTFRITEVLDAGAIPVLSGAAVEYYRHLYGGDNLTKHFVVYPTVSYAGVQQAVDTIKERLKDPTKLDEQAEAMHLAYETNHERWMHDIAERMAEVGRPIGPMAEGYP